MDADRDRDTTVKRPLLEREEEGESREHDPERSEPSPARAPEGKGGSQGETAAATEPSERSIQETSPAARTTAASRR